MRHYSTLTLVAFALMLAPLSDETRSQDHPSPGAAAGNVQEAPPPAQPGRPAAGQPAPAPAAAPGAPRPAQEAPPRAGGTPNVNVKIEVTITDQSGANPPVVKNISLVQANWQNGAVRTRNVVGIPVNAAPAGTPVITSMNYESLPLNLDAQPFVTDAASGKVRVKLSLNYETLGSGEKARTSQVTKNIDVWLDSGKPLVVSQSADAASDRKVTVEVKATILK
jgi:hypothetical protein